MKISDMDKAEREYSAIGARVEMSLSEIVNRQADELARLREENEGLRRDRERLDWLEKVKPAIEYIYEQDYEEQTREWFWKLVDENGCWIADEETLREAIDAATSAAGRDGLG